MNPVKIIKVVKLTSARIRKWIHYEYKHGFPKNQWFAVADNTTEVGTLYVRVGPRYINGTRMDTLDIGSIAINPEYQRNGIFSKLLTAFESMESIRAVYVENVHNDILKQYLTKRGYRVTTTCDISYYKIVNNLAE